MVKIRDCQSCVPGSIPGIFAKNKNVLCVYSSMVEHFPYKEKVQGSNPCGHTKNGDIIQW